MANAVRSLFPKTPQQPNAPPYPTFCCAEHPKLTRHQPQNRQQSHQSPHLSQLPLKHLRRHLRPYLRRPPPPRHERPSKPKFLTLQLFTLRFSPLGLPQRPALLGRGVPERFGPNLRHAPVCVLQSPHAACLGGLPTWICGPQCPDLLRHESQLQLGRFAGVCTSGLWV